MLIEGEPFKPLLNLVFCRSSFGIPANASLPLTLGSSLPFTGGQQGANIHPAGWMNPEPAARYNLVVIGAGTAGLVAADMLTRSGVSPMLRSERIT